MTSPKIQFTEEEQARINRMTEAGTNAIDAEIAVQKLLGKPIDFGAALKASMMAIHEEAQKPTGEGPMGVASEFNPDFEKP